MDERFKKIAVIAAVMAAAGLLLTGIGFLAGGNQGVHLDWNGVHVGSSDAGKLSSTLVSFSRDLGDFDSLSVDLDYYDVDLVPGDKYAIDVTYYKELGEPVIKVENGTLNVEDARPEPISVDLRLPAGSASHPGVKIYYPDGAELKDVAIRCGASDLSLEGITAEKADFELNLGKLELSDISAKDITVRMDSGECTLKNMTAAEELNITNQLGKTTLNGAKSKILKISANSGDVSLTDAVFDSGELNLSMGRLAASGIESNGLKASADKGEVTIQGKLRGLTDVSANMGAVTIEPGASKDQFSYELNTDLGSVSVEGNISTGSVSSSNASAKNTLKVKADMGDVRVNFD